MRKLMLLIIIVIAACNPKHKSELKTENGIVFDKSYSPEIDENSTGVGMSTGGKTVITTTHFHEDEKWNIVFKCEHGSMFVVDDKDLYSSLISGDSVIISFYDIIRDRDSAVIDYDFVTAVKK